MAARRTWSPVLVLLALGAHAQGALSPGLQCERAVADSLRKCVKKVARFEQSCFRRTGLGCLSTDQKVVGAYDGTSTKLLAKCRDQATVTAAGYSAVLTTSGLDARVRDACENAVATLVARSYGGPLGSARAGASDVDKKCLDNAFERSLDVMSYDLQQQSKCVKDQHAGRPCNSAVLATKIAKKEATATASIATKCPTAVETLVAVDAATQVSRAAAQSRCLTATAHADSAPLTLDCGPRAAVPVPPHGTPTQVVLPGATWGTRCGDGSDYAFWLRLAPDGAPVDKVVVFMQGGGACYDGPSCAAAGSQRFDALSDTYPGGGIFKPSDPDNPFRDWTVVFLPYCTQDLHIGGGVTDEFTEITVHRYGAINVRTAISYARDVIWNVLDATDPDGYRGNRVTALLTGGSAGAYGDAYNYHWVLDELRWPHTTAAPDSGLAMDNGAFGVIALGLLAITPTSPGWGSMPYLPAYCMRQECAEILDNLHLATAPRLKILPEQQILTISNQVDDVQRTTTLFSSSASWLNTLRTKYCAAQGGNGLHYFLSAQTATQHTQINGAKFYDSVVGGTSIAEWLGDAVTSPDSVIDKIATGTLETDVAGVAPFPCAVGSPSGVFVD